MADTQLSGPSGIPIIVPMVVPSQQPVLDTTFTGLSKDEKLAEQISAGDRRRIERILSEKSSLSRQYSEPFVRSIIAAILDPAKKEDVNRPARDLIEKSRDENFQDLKPVVQLLVNHARQLESHDLDKLLIHAEGQIAKTPLRIKSAKPHPELEIKEGCMICPDAADSIGPHASSILNAISEKFFNVSQPGERGEQKFSCSYERPLHMLTKLPPEEWIKAVMEERARRGIKSNHNMQAVEVLFRIYGLDGCRIQKTESTHLSAKWALFYHEKPV